MVCKINMQMNSPQKLINSRKLILLLSVINNYATSHFFETVNNIYERP